MNNNNVNIGSPNVDENNSNVNSNNTDINDIVNSLLNKNEEKANNLGKQRDIINDMYAENKQLKTEYEQLKKEYDELLKSNQANQNQNLSNSNTQYNEYITKLENLEKVVDVFERERKEKHLYNLFDTMHSYGVEKQDIDAVLKTINKDYKVDLVNDNISHNLVNSILADFVNKYRADIEPNYIPNGSLNHNYQNNIYTQQQEQVYKDLQDKINKRKQELDTIIAQKTQKLF